jgi:hypothetical protein
MAAAGCRGRNGSWFPPISLVIGLWAGIGWASVTAHADVILLRGGGQIQGKVIPDPKNPDRVQVLLLQGRHPLSFHKGQVVDVIAKPSPLGQGRGDGPSPVRAGGLVRSEQAPGPGQAPL